MVIVALLLLYLLVELGMTCLWSGEHSDVVVSTITSQHQGLNLPVGCGPSVQGLPLFPLIAWVCSWYSDFLE